MKEQRFKTNKKRDLGTVGVVALSLSLIVGGAYAALSDMISHNETVVIEWVDIIDSGANLALEDVSDPTNTPVSELIPGVTYELTGTIENDSTVVTNWSVQDLSATPGMTVTIDDKNGSNIPAEANEAIDVTQFGITVELAEDISPTAVVDLQLEFTSTDARDYVAPPTLAEPTALSVVFVDPQLATCVANDDEIIDITGGDVNYVISQEELMGVQTLDCSDYGISNIDGIQYITNLKDLIMKNNQISDLSALSSLYDLETLDLKNNQITDLTPLANLNNLNILRLSDNNISDVAPLNGLENLTDLNLNNNEISNFATLTNLPPTFSATNQSITLNDTMQGSATPVTLDGVNGEDLTITWVTPGTYVDGQLTWQNPGMNSLTYTSSDGKITGTITQEVIPVLQQQAAISSLFPDPAMAQCVANDPESNANGDVNALIDQATLDGFSDFSCGASGVVSIEGIQYMHNLTMASLYSNQITDLSPLANLTSLTELHLHANEISDLSPLEDLTNLTYLNLAYNNITDVSVLSGLTNLEYLNLFTNQITDISPLSTLVNLDTLELSANQISDLSPIAGLTNLTELFLANNQITDITPLSNLTNLTYLDLSTNQISNIEPLTNMTELTALKLFNNKITDITPISGLTKLNELYLHQNQITDFSSLTYQPANFDAHQSLITLPDVALGTATPIVIDGINGEDLIITFNTPGTYSNGQLIWENPGVNSLTYTSSDGKIAGEITQTVIGNPPPTLSEPTAISIIFPDPAMAACVVSDDELANIAGIGVNYVISQEELNLVTDLSCEDRGIRNIEGLQYLTNLTAASFKINRISDLTPLAELENLTHLDLSQNNIEDVSPLAGLTNLVHLDLGANPLSDITPLAALPNLGFISLYGARVSDFSALTYETSLYAANNFVILPDVMQGTSTPIIIDGVAGEDLTITFNTPGTYIDGQLTWDNPGDNSLTYESANGDINGVVHQYVTPAAADDTQWFLIDPNNSRTRRFLKN